MNSTPFLTRDITPDVNTLEPLSFRDALLVAEPKREIETLFPYNGAGWYYVQAIMDIGLPTYSFQYNNRKQQKTPISNDQ